VGLFRNKVKEIQITGTECLICGMDFTDNDRMIRHMQKAHGKSKKDSGSSCPNC
jgi:uncharacterized C2H2 Zn-finger protein